MTRKFLVLGCAALALLMVSVIANPADARSGGGHGFSGHSHGGRSFGAMRSYGGRSFHGGPRIHFGPRAFANRPHIYRRYGRRLLVGAPILYGGYTYYYGDCDWLRRRALYSGSPYWWDRYYACTYGGY